VSSARLVLVTSKVVDGVGEVRLHPDRCVHYHAEHLTELAQGNSFAHVSNDGDIWVDRNTEGPDVCQLEPSKDLSNVGCLANLQSFGLATNGYSEHPVECAVVRNLECLADLVLDDLHLCVGGSNDGYVVDMNKQDS
jgi:hypothetical protein